METELIKSILQPIRKQSIPICLVGEIALNYYNVPRVLHVGLQKSACLAEILTHHTRKSKSAFLRPLCPLQPTCYPVSAF